MPATEIMTAMQNAVSPQSARLSNSAEADDRIPNDVFHPFLIDGDVMLLSLATIFVRIVVKVLNWNGDGNHF